MGLLGQPFVYWTTVAITLLLVSYSVSRLANNFKRLESLKKKRAEFEAELTRINAKLEALRPGSKGRGEK